MQNLDLENVDCHAALRMIEKRWGFPRRTLRALLGMTKSGQSGRSMIEMLGVLAIIGVLSVGGISGYSKAMNKYRINKAIEQITLIAGNVRAFFGPQRNYIGIDCYGGSCGESSGCSGFDHADSDGFAQTHNGCPIIKKAKILPDEMITVNADGKITAITNPFGGEVYLEVKDKSAGNSYQAFSISYVINDAEVCIELLTKDWTTANVSFISVNNDNFSLPATIDKATESCSQTGSMTFFFDADVNYYKTDAYVDDVWY